MALSEETIELLKLNNKPNDLNYIHLAKLVYNLLNVTDLDGVLRYASLPQNRNFLINLSYCLFASGKLRKEFSLLEGYNDNFSRLVMNASSSLVKRQYRKGEDYLLFEFIGKRYLNVLKFYDEKVFEYNPLNTLNDKEVLSFSLNNASLKDADLPMVERLLNKYPSLNLNAEEMLKEISSDKKEEFLKENYAYFSFSGDVLSFLPAPDKIKYFETHQKEGITYILNHFDEFRGYEGQVIAFLFYNASFYRRSADIRKIIDKFEDNEYLKELFSFSEEDKQ